MSTASSTATSEALNVSLELRRRADEHPERCAVQTADGRSLSFGELERR